MDRATRNEAGFTLIELLVVLTIIPLVVGAIATALLATMRTQTGVAGQVSDSANAQITSALYVRDVQSATHITTTGTTTAPPPCGTGTTFLLGLNWADATAGGAVVSYWANPTAGSVTRLLCAVGSINPVSTVTMARGLTLSAGIRAYVAPGGAAASDWVPAAGISSVTLGALESSSAYRFDLVAAPRLSTPQSEGVSPGGNPPPPPLLLLGQTAPLVGCVGNGGIDVNGTAFMDSTADPSGQLNPNASITATHIYTSDANTAASFGTTGTVTPSPVYLPVQPDPYANLTPPSTNGLPVYSDGAYHGPGVYTSTLSLGNSTTVLATGIYVLRAGITLGGNGGVSSGPGGVLLYITGGSINFHGNAGVTLAPLSPAPYQSAPTLGIWQDKSDTTSLSLVGNGSLNSYQGTIYAPGAQVGGVGNAGYTAGAIVAASISCNGNVALRIGF